MQITFKLYASLTEFLPADRRTSNQMSLEVPAAATIAQIIEPFSLPMKMVHLVLINGSYVPPARCARGTCWPSGRRLPAADRHRKLPSWPGPPRWGLCSNANTGSPKPTGWPL